MSTKAQLIILGATAAVFFATGWWVVPTKTLIETKTVEVEKKTDTSKTNIDKDLHKETTTVETKTPDGTVTTVTKTTEDTKTDTKSKSTETDQKTVQSDTVKEVTREGAHISLAFLAGAPVSLSHGISLQAPMYGGSVTKDILGPIQAGAWGLSSGTFGVSLGLKF